MTPDPQDLTPDIAINSKKHWLWRAVDQCGALKKSISIPGTTLVRLPNNLTVPA
ncbi:hypothetical protein [Cupriavidus necator]